MPGPNVLGFMADLATDRTGTGELATLGAWGRTFCIVLLCQPRMTPGPSTLAPYFASDSISR